MVVTQGMLRRETGGDGVILLVKKEIKIIMRIIIDKRVFLC